MSRSIGFPLYHPYDALGGTLVSRALARIGDRFRRVAVINELEQLSDRQLRDIGLERREIVHVAEREIARLRAR